MESLHDYADIKMEKPIQPHEIPEVLNAYAPAGLRFSAAGEVSNNAAAVTAVADYALSNYTGVWKPILDKTSLIIPKKTKSGVKDADIRPDIFNIWQENGALFLRLAAGSQRFLNPLSVAGLIDPSVTVNRLTRLELYTPDMSPLLVL
jgi:hypothetical protein